MYIGTCSCIVRTDPCEYCNSQCSADTELYKFLFSHARHSLMFLLTYVFGMFFINGIIYQQTYFLNMFIRKRLHTQDQMKKSSCHQYGNNCLIYSVLFHIIIGFEEIMSHAILFISNDCIQVYILNASENIIFDHRILLSKFMNQFFDLGSL